MTAQEMIDQAQEEAINAYQNDLPPRLIYERLLLRGIIRHLCDPEQFPYPMTSPEL